MKGDLFSLSSSMSEIAKCLRKNFYLWGYEEIFLPTIERYDEELDKGLKFSYNDKFHLIEPDPTSQILKYLDDEESLRLFYISEVLDGSVEGNWQSGLELIGGRDLWMQVEILNVVISSLDKLGIEEFYVDIGSLRVWEDAIQDIREYRDEVYTALEKRNFEMIEYLPLEEGKKERLWELFNFRGISCDYEKLNTIAQTLDDDRVSIDFGTVRPLPYYEDLIFEVYSPELGYPIGAGGEYRSDGKRACGFAFDLGAILELYDGEVGDYRESIDKDLEESYRLAKKKIEEDRPIEVEQ